MLHQKAADANTWRVLEKLMTVGGLEDFHLAGGTALALRFGHRLSIDIDMFTPKVLEKEIMLELLEPYFPDFMEVKTNHKKMYFCYLDKVKTDFVHQPGNIVDSFEVLDGIRMWGLKDAVGMKLNAIYGRGSKKDFWDLDELLNYFSLPEMVDLFFEKSPHAFMEGLILSLVSFQNADEQTAPVCLRERNWDDIKVRIRNEVWKSFRFRK